MAQRKFSLCSGSLPGGWQTLKEVVKQTPGSFRSGDARRQNHTVSSHSQLTVQLPEVEIFAEGYVPEAFEINTKNILYHPNDILASSDLLVGKLKIDQNPSDSHLADVQFSEEGYLPPPEAVHGGNIEVSPDDILSTETSLFRALAEEVMEVEFLDNAYLPPPEKVRGENIKVTAADLLAEGFEKNEGGKG